MKKILIFGAGGFLGRHLVGELKKNEICAPNSSEVNLLNSEDFKLLDNKSYDEIFYLAAWTQAGDFCLKNKSYQWIINQKMNTNLISWWQEKQKQAKLIFIGSSCCYAEESDLKENKFLYDIPHHSLISYAMSKKMLTHGAMSCQDQFNMKWLCCVPATLYGKDYHLDNRQPHFIFDLIKKIIVAKFQNKKVELWGSGDQRREIINVKSFSKLLLIANESLNNDIVNLGDVKDYSIKEFAKMICEIVDFDDSKIVYNKTKYVGVLKKKLNIEKAKSLIINYEDHLTDIKTGLKEVINWYIDNKRYL